MESYQSILDFFSHPISAIYFYAKDNIKEFIYLLGLVITVWLFHIKLKADTKTSKYRETLAYIDRKYKTISELWVNLKESHNEALMEEYLNYLEHIALLVNENVFSDKLIYNSLWMHFYEPMKSDVVKKFINTHRSKDKTIYSNYVKLCEKWERQIKKEQGIA